MIDSAHLPSLDNLKAQAKKLRNALASEGQTVSHSRSLELMAHQFGFRDWNTLHASLGNQRSNSLLTPGQRVGGHYLGVPFAGKVIAVRQLSASGHTRVTFAFDEPVNVSKFENLPVLRHRLFESTN